MWKNVGRIGQEEQRAALPEVIFFGKTSGGRRGQKDLTRGIQALASRFGLIIG